MTNCPDPESDPCVTPGSTIADALVRLGPRTVEGDYGRVTMASVDDAIKAVEYDRSRCLMKKRSNVSSMLRFISGHRLAPHDGRGS